MRTLPTTLPTAGIVNASELVCASKCARMKFTSFRIRNFSARAASDETLKITLSTHEIALTGQRLEKMLVALQEFAVDWIRPLPTRYRNLDKGSDPLNTAVAVRALGE